MSAIDVLRERVNGPGLPDLETTREALAAVKELHRAAQEAAHFRGRALASEYPATAEALDSLAAAVRRVNGENK